MKGNCGIGRLIGMPGWLLCIVSPGSSISRPNGGIIVFWKGNGSNWFENGVIGTIHLFSLSFGFLSSEWNTGRGGKSRLVGSDGADFGSCHFSPCSFIFRIKRFSIMPVPGRTLGTFGDSGRIEGIMPWGFISGLSWWLECGDICSVLIDCPFVIFSELSGLLHTTWCLLVPFWLSWLLRLRTLKSSACCGAAVCWLVLPPWPYDLRDSWSWDCPWRAVGQYKTLIKIHC